MTELVNKITAIVVNAFPSVDLTDMKLTLDKEIEAYVRTHPDEEDEDKQYTLEKTNTRSIYYSVVAKAIIEHVPQAKLLFNRCNVMLQRLRGDLKEGRKTEKVAARGIDFLKSTKDDAIIYGISDATITLTWKDVPKGTKTTKKDANGKTVTEVSKRTKREFTITDIKPNADNLKMLIQLSRSLLIEFNKVLYDD